MTKKVQPSGFSLMELMIALIIIAILAGVAYPRYEKMVTRTRQTEAKTNLQAVFKAQEIYKISHLTYAAALADLDMEIGENSLYNYSIEAKNEGKIYIAKAEANIDDDSIIDIWTIDETNTLTNVVNDVLE